MEKRTFNSPARIDWNEKIANILRTIDLHNNLYFSSKNSFHLEQAEYLRNYIIKLKNWILSKESEF